jgi:DNA-binding NtrC family response regulator
VITREKFSVLILEDSETLLKSIAHAVRALLPEVTIQTARTVAEAQQIIAEARIHFYILETNLPVGSGIDFLCDLRTFAPEARVVMMSETLTSEQEQQLHKLGMLQHFPKPLEVGALAQLVQTHHNFMTSSTGQLDAKGEFAVSLTCPSALDIIQLKCLASATIMLQISSGHGTGRIYFNHGDIVHAEIGAQRGERAFEKILRWKGGRIKEVPLEAIPERSITTDWQGLLLRIAQNIDENVVTA